MLGLFFVTLKDYMCMEDYTWLKEQIDKDFPIFYGQWQIDQENQNRVLEKELIRYFRDAGIGIQKSKMSLKLRTKWTCTEVVDYGIACGTSQKRAKLNTVYSNEKNSEDNQFSNATPSGDCQQVITNQDEAVQSFFKPGKKYYATWEEAPD